MSERQIREKVEQEIIQARMHCQPQLLGHSDDGMVGFALTAPNSIVMAFSVSPIPVAGGFHDFCLN